MCCNVCRGEDEIDDTYIAPELWLIGSEIREMNENVVKDQDGALIQVLDVHLALAVKRPDLHKEHKNEKLGNDKDRQLQHRVGLQIEQNQDKDDLAQEEDRDVEQDQWLIDARFVFNSDVLKECSIALLELLFGPLVSFDEVHEEQ